jgi:hypothetical protein
MSVTAINPRLRPAGPNTRAGAATGVAQPGDGA